jgi:hypothetical protein
MSNHIEKTIEDLKSKLQEHEKKAIETKKLINQLSAYAGLPVPYQDADLQLSGGGMTVRRNAYFGRPLATCIREFLEMRKGAGHGPAALEAIFEALKEGGYDLETISAKGETEQKRGVAISMAKNTQNFLRLPTGDWGLVEWFPNVKKRKSADNAGKTEGDEDEPTSGGGDAPAPGSSPASEPEENQKAAVAE